MKPPGRPPSPPISVRLTVRVALWLHEQARRHGCTVSDVLNAVVLAEMDREARRA